MPNPLAKQIDFLLAGIPECAGGTATFYAAGTGNLKTIHLDKDAGTDATNPYSLDSAGRALLFGSGTYKIVLKDSDGVEWDTIDYLTYNTYINSTDVALAADVVALSVDAAELAETNAEASAVAAAASAATAVNSPGTSATSTTSLTVGTGDQECTIQTGKSFALGQPVRIARTSAPATVYMDGIVTAHDSETGALTVTVGSVTGAGTFTDWTIALSGPSSTNSIVRSARTENTILGIADRTTLVDITSGTFSQTITAAATLGDGWWCRIKNSGTGVVTLDPDGAETINGAATLALGPGASLTLQCTGTAFFTTASFTGTHKVVVHTGNGYGSTNTAVRRFTTTLVSTGTAITYADSAANGGLFTINEDGFYSIFRTDGKAVTNAPFFVSLNSAGLTTNPAVSEIIIWASTGAGTDDGTGRVLWLAAGSLVRPQENGALDATGSAYFSIEKVGAL